MFAARCGKWQHLGAQGLLWNQFLVLLVAGHTGGFSSQVLVLVLPLGLCLCLSLEF